MLRFNLKLNFWFIFLLFYGCATKHNNSSRNSINLIDSIEISQNFYTKYIDNIDDLQFHKDGDLIWRLKLFDAHYLFRFSIKNRKIEEYLIPETISSISCNRVSNKIYLLNDSTSMAFYMDFYAQNDSAYKEIIEASFDDNLRLLRHLPLPPKRYYLQIYCDEIDSIFLLGRNKSGSLFIQKMKNGTVENFSDSLTNPIFEKFGKYFLNFNLISKNKKIFFHTAIPFECFFVSNNSDAIGFVKSTPKSLADWKKISEDNASVNSEKLTNKEIFRIARNKDSIRKIYNVNQDTILIFSRNLFVKNLEPTVYRYITLISESGEQLFFMDITNTQFGNAQYVGLYNGFHYWLSINGDGRLILYKCLFS